MNATLIRTPLRQLRIDSHGFGMTLATGGASLRNVRAGDLWCFDLSPDTGKQRQATISRLQAALSGAFTSALQSEDRLTTF